MNDITPAGWLCSAIDMLTHSESSYKVLSMDDDIIRVLHRDTGEVWSFTCEVERPSAIAGRESMKADRRQVTQRRDDKRKVTLAAIDAEKGPLWTVSKAACGCTNGCKHPECPNL